MSKEFRQHLLNERHAQIYHIRSIALLCQPHVCRPRLETTDFIIFDPPDFELPGICCGAKNRLTKNLSLKFWRIPDGPRNSDP